MDFFSKLGDSIVNATQEVGEKAKGMTDIAKLQYEMRTKEAVSYTHLFKKNR